MEKKQTNKVTIAAIAVTPKKKKRYYPSKKARVQAIAAKGEKKPKLDGNLASAKVAEKAKKEVVQPEPASFVWAEDKQPTWMQRVLAWLTSIGK
jgi:hypothetical protein